MTQTDNNETEGDIYGTSYQPLEYETTLRDRYREKVNMAFADSWRGRLGSFISRHFLQLRQNIHRFGVVLKRFIGVIKLLTIKGIDFLRVFLYNEYCNKKLRKDKQMSNKTNTKETTNTNEETKSKRFTIDWKATGRGIIGLGLFLSVASMVLSAAIIYKGTDDLVSKVIIAPMAIYAFIILVKVFTSFTHKGDK